MGTLTADMARLRSEIDAMREGRHAMRRELSQDIATLKRDVANSQAAFRRAFAGMVKNSRENRIAFVSNLNQDVSALLRMVADDMEGARRAWRG